LANWWYETKLLGYSYSSSLSSIFSNTGGQYIPLKEVTKYKGKSVFFAGMVDEKVKSSISKAGKKYVKLSLRDEQDVVTVLVFDKVLQTLQELPQKDDILLIKGSVKDEGAVFAEIIGIQNAKIYTKLSELTRDKKKEAQESSEASSIQA